MKTELNRLVPPGFDWGTELKWSISGLAGSLVLSLMLFFFEYGKYYSRLFRNEVVEGRVQRVLIEGAVMPDFASFAPQAMYGFAIVATSAILWAILHYSYHYRGSRSIYLMRRLPCGMELHLRCLTLPVCLVLVSLALGFVFLLLYYWYYMARTPDVCLMPDQWAKLWNAIL